MQKNCNLDDVEWIIVNGNPKNEKTLEVIEDFKDKGIVSWSQSERDGGIYNAMNIGMEHATSPWVWFLNSHDVMYHHNALRNVQSAAMIPGADFVYTDYMHDKTPRKAFNFSTKRIEC